MNGAARMAAVCAAALAAGICMADGAPARPHRKLTPEQLREAIHRVNLKKTGGKVRKPGSAQGVFTVLNAQSRVAAEEFAAPLATIDRWMRVQTALKTSAPGLAPGGVKAAIAAAGGAAGVALVDDPSLPALLAAPEEGWAAVNVAALAKDGAGGATLAARTRKELLRGFAFATGGAYLNQTDYMMRDVAGLADLDRLGTEGFGVEFINRFPESAPRYGLKPWHQTTYRQACMEGWAPAPTNDAQKAIWEQVRADKERGPTNPIEIPMPGKSK